jgi:ubiquinone/menaquinone biosynthesis C-methylase UbiE
MGYQYNYHLGNRMKQSHAGPMTSHDQHVLQQFDPRASAYLTSAVHAAGPDLEHARRLVAGALPAASAVALDAGCGAGHLGFALAPLVARLVAADPAPSMLATVQAAALERGFPHIETCQAAAESLPFAAASFCRVARRYSAHHWRDVPAALGELRRVVKPGGWLLMIDLLGGATPLVDTHLQAMELLRDPSHVRDYTVEEWRRMIAAAGFDLLETQSWPVQLEFRSWVERMRTPAEPSAAIRRLQQGAPQEVRSALALEEDGSFTPRVGLFWARAAA